ncbi:anaphase-promoting complex subunit 4 [Pectinophora gossypiella]|uniref:Anaphase-promoting complex subunit 4 n=1 Tax=Pectinophora gossypiella TaxID=13191 RepID=A0A1E1W2B8_PECGO|nr:anaphase-promoting complex subunit 4 [Pectinophora gossypiella]
MYHCGMRQMEERHVANQVEHMVWSNRLDLLAISNFKGEVQVHRLHWQKVWNLPPPKENVTVRAMAWRPDGKALAIGYSSGSVYIVDIEDKEVLDKYDLELEKSEEFDDTKHYGITCVTWAVREGNLESATEYNIYDDPSIFLQKPPSLSSGFKNPSPEDNVKDLKEIQEPTQLNMLIVGYGTGYIYMSIFGRYPYGTIHLAQVAKDECGEYKVLDICLSNDFSLMQVCYLDRSTNNVFVSLINTSVLSAYAEEMFVVANRHGQVVHLVSYLDQTMTSITEAWEHILLEMDTKMAYYAASVPEGGVSADLLELLMLGVPSDELELFLLQELTAKGLKKFGSSVELSYSTIQKLVLKQLNIVGQSLTYYLAELRGLTRVPDRYKILGLEETTVTEAIRACCAFLNKCLELQQVIDSSMRNYKAFFRWLFVVIVRLLDEQTPSEIVKITQQDLTHIAEFLYNFDNVQTEGTESTSEKPVKFNLERLGQYLQDQDLTILPDDEDNPWHKFLKENPCLVKDSDTIFSMAEFRSFSLVQQQKFLKNAINKVFDVTEKDVGKYFSILFNIRCYENKSDDLQNNLRVSQIFDATQRRFMLSFVNTTAGHDGLCFLSVDIKEKACNSTATKYYFSPCLVQDTGNDLLNEEHIAVLDLQFYSSEYLSVLTSHPNNSDSSIFIQLPLKIAVDNSAQFNIKSKSCVFTDKISRRDISPLLDQGVTKILDKMDGYRIAVSGGRKVAVVLAKSYRKVRVFEMEVDGDDEEDDTLDVTPQSQANKSDDQVTPA